MIKSRRQPNRFYPSAEAEVTEYVYFKEDIADGDGNTISWIAKDISDMLDSGHYADSSGIAIVNQSPATTERQETTEKAMEVLTGGRVKKTRKKPATLKDAIRQHFGIEYEPLNTRRNEKHEEQSRGVSLADSTASGEQRGRVGPGSTSGRKRSSGGGAESERGGGASRDSRGSGIAETDRGNQEQQNGINQGNSLGKTGDRSLDDFFGPVITGFEGKGKEAEEYLRDTCEGVVKGALTYPGVSPIDLAWGDRKAGYMKILVKHPEVAGKLQVILNETTIKDQSDNRIVFESDTHKIIVSKMKGSSPTDNWLLTAYEKKKKSVSASSSDIETEPGGKRNGTAAPQNRLISGRKDSDSLSDRQVDEGEIESKTQSNGIDPWNALDRVQYAKLPNKERMIDVGWDKANGFPAIYIEHPSEEGVAAEITFDGAKWRVNIVPVKEWNELSERAHRIIDKGMQPVKQRDYIDKYVPKELQEYFTSDQARKDNNANPERGAKEKVYKDWGIIFLNADTKYTNYVADETAAESSKAYTITPTTYTRKKGGGETPVWVVKFDKELSKEEKAALRAFTREPLTEGKKTSKGWVDKDSGDYFMRSEEAAKALAEMIGNEEAVADAQPMTAEELREAVGTPANVESNVDSKKPNVESKKPVKPKKPEKAPANRVSLEDVMTDLSEKGETRLSEHAEPLAEARGIDKKADAQGEVQYEISDEEMASLADELRDLLGIGDDEGDRSVRFRDPEELTPLERQKIQSAGIRMAMGLIERGVTKFPDLAERMVAMLGDKIRPWLKSFYEGARWTPGYKNYNFTPSEEVAKFDVENFDKPAYDVIKDAEMRVEERKAQQAAKQAEKELKETRNKQRKENDKQREADTAALAEKADAVANQTGTDESLAGVGRTGEVRKKILRTIEKADETLDEINDQLALLGYYEEDLDSA